jgi:predicted nucleic acid-binding protein
MAVLFPKKYTINELSSGEYVDGWWEEGAMFSMEIEADIQPLTGRELESLDVGRRGVGKIRIYTDKDLQIADAAINDNGDIVIYDEKKYEIISKEPRKGIMNHNKYIAELRMNE